MAMVGFADGGDSESRDQLTILNCIMELAQGGLPERGGGSLLHFQVAWGIFLGDLLDLGSFDHHRGQAAWLA